MRHLWGWGAVCASVVGMVVGATAPSAAYRFFETQSGTPWRWWHRSTPLPFHVAQVTPEEIPLDQVPALVKAAFDTWRASDCGVPEVVYAGPVAVTATTAPVDVHSDPDNIVLFVRSSAEWAALGHSQSDLIITKVYADPDTGEIVDADTEVNDAGYVWSLVDGPLAPGTVDLKTALLHEAGHFLGLDHSLDPTATMVAAYPHPTRTLAQDDITGVCALYAGVPEHVDPFPVGEDGDDPDQVADGPDQTADGPDQTADGPVEAGPAEQVVPDALAPDAAASDASATSEGVAEGAASGASSDCAGGAVPAWALAFSWLAWRARRRR